ncbi:MAG: APC family permease, partial [Thermodesulfobacteriota bacterium]
MANPSSNVTGVSSRPAVGRIGLFAAMSIGIGGMIGAGIFSILGVVAQASGTAMWISFLIGGVVALLSTYSYAKLGARYPSAGGAVEFLVKGFGDGVLSGGINMYMWVGYVIALALYAQAFAGYAMTFFPPHSAAWAAKAIGTGIVVLFTVVNVIGASFVGRSETLIVIVKLAILLLFAVAGLLFIHPTYLAPNLWPPVTGILFGAGVLFIGYEGFGLVANAAEDMDDPQRMLPKALYLSVIAVIVIYVAVSLAVIGNLDVPSILKAKDYALAQAAKPFLGDFGFRLVAVGALFSTASAINATLFGAANVSYMIARDGELPRAFSWRIRPNATGGLFITAGVVILFVLFFDLSSVAMMGSGAFLLIYASVHA